jgi:hypothetical protein
LDFWKNSDREPNEAQSVVDIPAQEHAAGSLLNCTYRSVPQARFTNRVILSNPSGCGVPKWVSMNKVLRLGMKQFLPKYRSTKKTQDLQAWICLELP